MTHDESFLLAIREAPADDSPRLIYADWLEEHGQADRAEFIRVQCRLARLQEAEPEKLAMLLEEGLVRASASTFATLPSRWSTLLLRAEGLLRGHWDEWVGPLRDIVGPWRDRYGERWLGEEYDPDGLWRFQRGFVNGISLEADSFLRHAPELRLLIPHLKWLHLWGASGRIRALAHTPELEGLSILSFIDYHHSPLTAEDAAALVDSPYLHGLSTLQLGWNSLGDDGVVPLVRAPWLDSLTWLALTDNGLSDRAARALAESPHLRNLKTLYLERNYFSADGVAALTNSPNLRQLTHLECGSVTQHFPFFRNDFLEGSACS